MNTHCECNENNTTIVNWLKPIMKNLFKSISLCLMMIPIFNFTSCKKSSDSFCSISRTSVGVITEQSATVIYYEKYKRYGIRIDITQAGNIDSQLVGLSCDIPKELLPEGTRVRLSGQLLQFNPAENIRPEMGGDDLYYLRIIQITKQ